MPSWGAVTYGVLLSGLVAALAVALVLRDRRGSVLVTAAVSAAAAPLAWDLVLRHTGGDFFTDAPGVVFPISFEDTGSGVFATALSALLLGFGPLRAADGRRVALTATVCGLAALLVDIYLY
jgi:membrane-associated phospholipid phosphatase